MKLVELHRTAALPLGKLGVGKRDDMPAVHPLEVQDFDVVEVLCGEALTDTAKHVYELVKENGGGVIVSACVEVRDLSPGVGRDVVLLAFEVGLVVLQF